MTAEQFNQLPLLLRLRDVVACDIPARDVRLLDGSRILSLRPRGDENAQNRKLYLRTSLADLMGYEMDWAEFESWPALLTRYHLLCAGLHDEDIQALRHRAVLRSLCGYGARRYYKHELAKLVGYAKVLLPKRAGMPQNVHSGIVRG